MVHTQAATDMSLDWSYELFEECLARYVRSPLFGHLDEWVIDDNPFRRPIRPQDVDLFDFTTKLAQPQVLTGSGLMASRMLLNIYETDLLFLPQGPLEPKYDDFQRFYAPEVRALGEMIRPVLERHTFGFLDDEVDVSGKWTVDSVQAYLQSIPELSGDPPENRALKAIRESRDPEQAAWMYLIQFASDFLSEASAMARVVTGNYGEQQSELFKVLIDEYGYGVHDTKHSTLFEQLLASLGLANTAHSYWQFYMPSSLLLTNYWHYICKNHEHFFRYLGALYYTEASLVGVSRQAAELFRDLFGDTADVRYFTEHVHIDVHHGRMALEKLLLPALERFGADRVAPEMVRGVEEFRLLCEIADGDFEAQVAWIDQAAEYRELAATVYDSVNRQPASYPFQRFVEGQDELSVTHVHDVDELCHVTDGSVRFVSGPNTGVVLNKGDNMLIPSCRLHGSIVESGSCTYDIYPIGDFRKCLS
jgi:hypothetical protein